MSRNALLWMLWSLLTFIGAGAVFAALYIGGDRTVLLPGQTAGAHHQLEIACETCHTSDPFDSQATVRKDINKTCTTCHKDELKEADDSHPKKKFTNPRMASYWEKIDGRFCTSCHSEHQPEITLPMMVTLQGDYCVACHSEGEQDAEHRAGCAHHRGIEQTVERAHHWVGVVVVTADQIATFTNHYLRILCAKLAEKVKIFVGVYTNL